MSTTTRHFLLAFVASTLLTPLAPLHAAEYFVNKRGLDENAGSSRQAAFRTIQKGLDALEPGDTLTIGPGEYAECVKLVNFGSPDKDTLIRAEIPATVLLRGDRDADVTFTQVGGRRFVYAADLDRDILSVMEVDTLTILAPAANVDALEFGPGRYFHDPAARRLFLSSSDFQPPQRHRYTFGQLEDHGFLVRDSRRVVIDGLAASGYLSSTTPTLLFPASGLLLQNTQRCVVRRCTAFLDESGITMNSDPDGHGNLVENCRAYGNVLDGIVGYNPNGETIRDCRSFLNRTYGMRFYGARRGESSSLLSNLLAWGNPGGDFWMKGKGLSDGDKLARAERCIALKNAHLQNIAHCITGGGSADGDRYPDSIALPQEESEFHRFADREFADAANMDFRLQETSSHWRPGPGYPYRGAFPFEANVYYVAANGDDGLDGLSMAKAWKTLAHAFKSLRPGDTLYVAAGRYASPGTVTARRITVRGRGMEPAIIDGPLSAVHDEDVTFERLHFAGPIRAESGRNVSFADCVFSGNSALGAVDVQGLSVTHSLLTAALILTKCSNVSLGGNLYAAAPAFQTDALDDLLYSDYNSYPDADRCCQAGEAKILSLSDLQQRHDAHSRVTEPELGDSGGAVTVKNAFQFAGRGPLGTAIGLHREWQPRSAQLVGPFVHSVSDTTADLEWWSALPIEVEFHWGEAPDCADAARITQSSFYSYSLIGLTPGRTYHVKLKPARIHPDADPGRRLRLSGQEWTTLTFTTERQGAAARTCHVAPDGRDDSDGLSRKTAWRTLQHAADSVRPGDTVLLAGGTYGGTVYFRSTGDRDRPITFKAIPGEKVMIDGLAERLKVGLVLYGKHFYRLDSLYVQGFAGIEDNVAGAENGGLLVDNGSHLEVTRCHFSGGWGPCLVASSCDGILARNCVFMHSMSSVTFSRCPDLTVEHNVFIAPLIHHLMIENAPAEPSRVTSNIFGENTRHKAQICFVSLSRTTAESNNCFYLRWPENERTVMNGLTLPEYRNQVRPTDSFVANPQMPGAIGWSQGWQQIPANDFGALFAANPELVKRGIGLQPEAFRDFHFKVTDGGHDVTWANDVLGRQRAAMDLVKAGNDAGAMAAFTKLATLTRGNERLKSEYLDQAALCAGRLKQYDQALVLARSIPLKPLSIRRQMALMVENGRYGDLLDSYADSKMGGSTFHLSWTCPELEDVIADALYYRSLAYVHANDLAAAEADLKVMLEKREKLQYSSGEGIHEAAWVRLGDFYTTHAKDDRRALQAYGNVIERTMLAPYRTNVIDKPAFTGDSRSLVAATRSAAEILRRQGKDAEALRIEFSLLRAQAEALAHSGSKAEAISRFTEAMAVKGVSAGDKETCEKRIQQLQAKAP